MDGLQEKCVFVCTKIQTLKKVLIHAAFFSRIYIYIKSLALKKEKKISEITISHKREMTSILISEPKSLYCGADFVLRCKHTATEHQRRRGTLFQNGCTGAQFHTQCT